MAGVCGSPSLTYGSVMPAPSSRFEPASSYHLCSICIASRLVYDVAKHERNRGLRMSARKSGGQTNSSLVGIPDTASITASRLIDDYDKLPAFLEALGFKVAHSAIRSLPGQQLSQLHDSGLVNYSNGELIELYEKIKRMKRRSRFPVVNPTESLDEMQRHLRGEKRKIRLSRGPKYFTRLESGFISLPFLEKPCARSMSGRIETHPDAARAA